MKPAPHLPLTERQLEIIDCIADGLTNPEIARRLYIAENTVKLHVRRIFRRLGCHTRAQVAALAVKNQELITTRGDDLVLRDIVRDAVLTGRPDRAAQARMRDAVTAGVLAQDDYTWTLAASKILERLRLLDMTCTSDDGMRMAELHDVVRTMQEVPDPYAVRETAAVG